MYFCMVQQADVHAQLESFATDAFSSKDADAAPPFP
jgi:hypothetical protein